MPQSLWRAVAQGGLIGPLAVALQRVVESQQHVATMQLVDTCEEQDLLEQLLEQSKPAVAPAAAGLHYLLMTPFRYPPLRHGSRFGGVHQRGIFYGALNLETALAECAYYRLVFLAGLAQPFPAPITTYHTAFACRLETPRGLDLQQPALVDWQPVLRSPCDYRFSQRVGELMREAGVEAFLFGSARCEGINAGVMEPAALVAGPLAPAGWACRTSVDEVRFVSTTGAGTVSFPRAQFLLHGALPAPAVV